MNQRLPFYMVYDTDNMMMDWNTWDEEWISRRDYEYMKSIYPETAKQIYRYVEEECDRIEYSGSMLFDEYPDQLQLRLLCRRIYEKVQSTGITADTEQVKESKNWKENWLMELIQVITWQEILKRRKEYRKYRRKFY